MRKLLFTFICFFALVSVSAEIKVTGNIKSSDDNEPVIGASVVAKGTTIGTITNYDGDFSLSVPNETKIVVVSYVGMATQEIVLKPGQINYNVVLNQDLQHLDELIVVAYGTTKKASFTGSAATVGADKISKMQVSEVSKALEGAVAGVQISSSSGQPGSSAAIRIRGIGSLSASSAPLIVVDGVPYEGGLNTINPSDIESMNVLKDAAANSMYGARGANGVIMITTKKSTQDKVRVTFENRTGFNSRGVDEYSTLTSSKEYYELYWEAIRNEQQNLLGQNSYTSAKYASDSLVSRLGGYNSYDVANGSLVGLDGRLNPNANLLYQDNWFDEAFSYGLRQENYLSVAGGTDKLSTFFSLGFLSDDSYTEQSNLLRFSGRAKIDYKVNKWLSVGANVAYSTLQTNVPAAGGTENTSDIFNFAQNVAPIYPVYRRNSDGSYVLQNGQRLYDYGTTEGHTRPYGSGSNAISEQANNIRKSSQDIVNAKVYARVDFLKHFNFTANLSADNSNRTSVDFQTPVGGDALSVNGRSTKSAGRSLSINTNQLLNYTQVFNNVHSVNALIGHEIKYDYSTGITGSKSNFFLPDNPELDNGALITSLSSSESTYFLQGIFSRAEYGYNDKYYLSASYRVDGSSRFHPDKRWGSFWSVGASWRATQESFMAPTSSWLNDLKVRASFGTQGNDNIGNFAPYKDQYVVTTQDGELALVYSFRGNPDITWEKSNNFNAGIDFALWNRFSGTIEFFNKETWDMIYSKPLPPSSGSPTYIVENCMRMVNTGVELELSADLIRKNGWRWNLSINMTHYKNVLKELPDDRPQEGWITQNYKRYVGASIYNLYGKKYAGVDPSNGSPLYYKDVLDTDGNVVGQTTTSVYDEADEYEYGKTTIPDLYGGFSTLLSWKGIELSASFAYQIGGWVNDYVYQSLMHGGIAGRTWHTDIYDRWTPTNTGSNTPLIQTSSNGINDASDRFYIDASYLSLRNVQLSYTLPKSVTDSWKMSSARVYVTGDNLFLLSRRKGLDPRQSFSGATAASYSPMRTVSLGLQINF